MRSRVRAGAGLASGFPLFGAPSAAIFDHLVGARNQRSLRDRERKQKGDAVAGGYQMDRTTMGAQHRSHDFEPQPVPPLARLVVKNGIKILSRLLSTIGSPSFVTATETMSADL
jgi:hypothetical protein